MRIRSLRVVNFRNIELLEVVFPPGVNLLFGGNGQGKTSILEAIYVLCTSFSFRARKLSQMLMQGKEHFYLYGDFKGEVSLEHEVIYRARTSRKEVYDSGKKAQGEGFRPVPAVVFSPDMVWLLYADSAARRRELDAFILLASPGYSRYLSLYSKALSQRNFLLRHGIGGAQLEAWTRTLAEVGLQIVGMRRKAAGILNAALAEASRRYGAPKLTFSYTSMLHSAQTVRDALSAILSSYPFDRQRGATTVGPHRDDWTMLLEGMDLRYYGSQGQKKLATVMLRAAQMIFWEKVGRKPILLLDDVFAALDEDARGIVEKMVSSAEQCFITSTEVIRVAKATAWTVEGGRVRKCKGWEI